METLWRDTLKNTVNELRWNSKTCLNNLWEVKKRETWMGTGGIKKEMVTNLTANISIIIWTKNGVNTTNKRQGLDKQIKKHDPSMYSYQKLVSWWRYLSYWFETCAHFSCMHLVL